MSKIYLLSGLTQTQLSDLSGAGVEYSNWDSNTISIAETYRAQTLQALRADASETASDFQDVFQLKLRSPNRHSPLPTKNLVLTPEQQRSRANYIDACSARASETITSARAALEEQKQAFPDKVQRFILDKRDATFCQNIPDTDALTEKFLAQFQELVQLPKVIDLRITAQDLMIYTDVLYATAPSTGRRHEIGKFMIVVNLDGKNSAIRWFNSTRRVNAFRPGMNAPNVYEDGTASQNDLTATFYELIARLQFAALADVAIQFIEEVTSDDLATFISNWPLAGEGAAL